MTIKDEVYRVFSRLVVGDLTKRISPVQDGWEVDLPSGRTVARSILQEEARSLIAIGPDAVPHLLPWVANDYPALRYVAIFALEQITGEKPHLPYFDQADHGEGRTRAIEVWRRWYAAHERKV